MGSEVSRCGIPGGGRRGLVALVLVGCTTAEAPAVARVDATAPATSSPTSQPAACGLGSAPPAETWVAPHAPVAACDDAEIEGYREACLQADTAIPIACQQFTQEHADCAECIFPSADGAPAGALLPRAGRIAPNVGGCIADALDDPSDTGCGAREQAARDCLDEVCADCSDSCRAVAREGVCADLVLRSCPELAGAASCALHGGPDEEYRRIARRLCGPR